MSRPLNEQVVVITGASTGIGRETAIQLGRRGATVVLAARNDTALQEVAAEVEMAGGRSFIVPTDVAVWEEVQNLAEESIREFGRIDTWFNNAAVSVYATVEDTTLEEFERIMQVNFMGQVYGVKAVLPHMKRQGGGTIINMGSIESERAFPYHSAYAASKHAVKGFTDAMRLEQEREQSGITLTLIKPAGINTPFFEHTRSKLGVQPMPPPPLYEPAAVAEAVVFAAEHPRRDLIIGGMGKTLLTMERVSSSFMDWFMLRGDWSFKLQKSDLPDNHRDNLDAAMPLTGSRGDYGKLAHPTSFYTRHLELHPNRKRALLLAGLGVAFLLLRNKQPHSGG
ncbi:MAG: SDR family NAD(P)-dependent oxidoreductase [Armatimonadetes bacterium]|nr:SDR family NAD(P)-dependent oxidoreductase [Armatimonadota bacterium]